MGKLLNIDSSTDLDIVGGLGSYLAILKRKGFNIADGFVIPIGIRLENGVCNEIIRRFDSLNTESVTLRSSPILHELDGEVIRDVKREALIEAIAYLQRNITRRGRRAAIIVQRHLTAEISGTAFSINPSTGSISEIFIEAHLWMNSTVLTGESEPDIVVVRKNTGALILESEEEQEICLTQKQIEQIYNAMRKTEHISATQISIDWAFDNDRLYILRVRPITDKILERYHNDSDNINASS